MMKTHLPVCTPVPRRNWTEPDTVTALKSAIDSYVAAHRIDPDRIYIGMSMGGTVSGT